MMVLGIGQVFSTWFSSYSSTTFIILVFFAIFMGTILLLANRAEHGGLDIPGPWSFPVIGCMYLFRWSTFPHKTLSWLTRIYGDVYCLKLGSTQVVVVNSTEAVKECLYRKGSDFAGRPMLFSFGLWGRGQDALMLKSYDSNFSNMKYKAEISIQRLLNEGESMDSRSLKAVQSLCASFEPLATRNRAFDPEKAIKVAIADFVMDSMFGQPVSRWFYQEARSVLEQATDSFVKSAYAGACVDFVHVMRYFSRRTSSQTSFQVAQLHEFVRNVFHVHRNSFSHLPESKASLAYLLRSGDKGYRAKCFCSEDGDRSDLALDCDQIVLLLADTMFNAYEKLSTSFRWCVARVAANINLQREIQEELETDALAGRRNATKLSLLAATVNETLRTTCIMPLGIPRKTIRDTTLRDYAIPKDTVVFLNLWSCCNDAQSFSNPQEFNPYRYFSQKKDGLEVSGEKVPLFCSFSGGERKCLGDTFSRRFLVTLTGGILRKFDLVMEKPDSCTPLPAQYALTMRPKSYRICVRKKALE